MAFKNLSRKSKSRLSILLGIVVLIAAFGITAVLASMKEAPERKAIEDHRVIVPTVEVINSNLQTEVSVIGKISGKEKIEIYSEVTGILEKTPKSFLEGISYNKGEVLLKLNSEETYMNLVSKRSSLLNLIIKVLPELKFDYPDSYNQWKNYLDNFDIEKNTTALPKPFNNQEKYFIAGQNIYQTYYDIISMETRYKKYNIYAPFNGVVSNCNIKPGTLVMAGQKLGEYFNPYIYDLETEIKLSDISFINVGDTVPLISDNINYNWQGIVNRISKTVDNKTQTVKVFITVKGDNLKEGMFLSGTVKTNTFNNAYELPRKLMVNNNQVFTVNDNKIQSQTFQIVNMKESSAIVTGLEDGTIISQKTKGIYNGMNVRTDNGFASSASSQAITTK